MNLCILIPIYILYQQYYPQYILDKSAILVYDTLNHFSIGGIMDNLHIRDILVSFKGDDLSKYGLFPLFAWYLIDYVQLLKRLKPLTVKRKRNNKNPIKRRTPKFKNANISCYIR